MNSNESEMPWWRDQDSIVISGVSCRFPESDNMAEFAEHLLNGDDLVTEDNRRWEPGTFFINFPVAGLIEGFMITSPQATV